jgi:hypothetical protein
MNETHVSGTAQQEGSAPLGKAQAEQGVRYTLDPRVSEHVIVDLNPCAPNNRVLGHVDIANVRHTGRCTELVRRANAAQVLAEALEDALIAFVISDPQSKAERFKSGVLGACPDVRAALNKARAALAQWEAGE